MVVVAVAAAAAVVAVAVAVTVAAVADVGQSRMRAHSSLAHSFIGVSLISRNLVRHFICDLGKRCQTRLGLLSRLSHARSFGKLSMADEDYSYPMESLP